MAGERLLLTRVIKTFDVMFVNSEILNLFKYIFFYSFRYFHWMILIKRGEVIEF